MTIGRRAKRPPDGVASRFTGYAILPLALSADNYLFVRKRPDGRFGISMRFASDYYEDSDADCDTDWISPVPKDQEVYATAAEAIFAAHRMEDKEYVEYGVSLGDGVLEDADARLDD